MLLDPDNYSDPEQFKPSRFLKKSSLASGSNAELDIGVMDPSNLVFGFGRRACPGRWFAYDSLWIAISSILATFNISPVEDIDGHPVLPQGGYIDNFISYERILFMKLVSLLIPCLDIQSNSNASLRLDRNGMKHSSNPPSPKMYHHTVMFVIMMPTMWARLRA